MKINHDTNPSITPSLQDHIKSAWEDIVLYGRSPKIKIRKEVYDSWHRCIDLGLDPLNPPSPPILKKHRLQKLQKANEDLIRISKPVLQMITIFVGGTGFILTLAEKNGYVLDVQGDKDVLAMAQRNYYLPGCNRATEKAGTNGIGLCLDVGKPIQLTGAEHYNVNHHPWTCSSAPIKGKNGDMVGAITLSGRSVGQHRHTLALITAAANSIEAQLRERDLKEGTQRLNTMLTTIYNSISDGFIALNTGQRITHLNAAARNMLGVKSDEVTGMLLEKVALPEKKLLAALRSGDYVEASEIHFNCQGGIKTFMCRVDPIQTETFKLLGTIITMTEHRKMVTIAKKIGGNYAKYEFSDIKGKSPNLTKQIEMAKLAAKTSSRILIMGESGTGKELFAQALHSHSHRAKGPFVAISCAAIPRDLIESELFGYKGGAFTGARQKGMMGKFELANGGTLFLDEINGLPLELQGKLLRVLQQNEIMRLGDNRPIPVDVRVIAASNIDLIDEVENGNFREDLYYRLNVMEIFIPPLRERIDDLELLIAHILDRCSNDMQINRPSISVSALKALKNYSWPGNVRELENTLERALLLSQGNTIKNEHLSLRSRKKKIQPITTPLSLNQGYKEMIKTTLNRCDGNFSKAAKELNIARSTLYRKMKEFDIT